jgi:cellulose biosynthesis protein BcsQ
VLGGAVMSGNKSPKTIATINFKGGVGKTTVTWCVADTLSTYSNAAVLMFDLDAQMSLTQAVGLNEDNGTLYPAFGSWYEKSVNGRRTIFDAIDQYTKPGVHFDFPIAYDFIYQISNGLHFVPSVEDLYWLELEVFDRDQMKDFMRRLLGKIALARRSAVNPSPAERSSSTSQRRVRTRTKSPRCGIAGIIIPALYALPRGEVTTQYR